jgi:RNase adaptor protein for sRNA GlmZ degradation
MITNTSACPLTVTVMSFSFRNPPSWADHPHGGGFVFDCRVLPNPGREEQFKKKTGLDIPVQEYLKGLAEFDTFFSAATTLVDQAVTHHIGRGFDQLVVAFGCTGGQHRSVYCAQRMADQLRAHVRVDLEHREASNWPSR